MSVKTHRQYLATVILDTRGYDQPVESIQSFLTETLLKLGAEVSASRNLGRQDFVRVTERHHTGDSYLEIEFAGPSSAPNALHERTRLDKRIKRILIQNR